MWRVAEWGPRQWLTLVLCGCVAAALLVWLVAGSGNGSRTGPREIGPDYTPMTASQTKEAEGIAVDDQVVDDIAGQSKQTVSGIEPWINSAGKRLLGAVVHIRLDPPVRMQGVKVPVYVTPGPDAPAGTPSLERVGVMSATGVAELNASVLLEADRVVAVEPSGRRVAVTEERLLGPEPGPAYRRPEGE